MCQFDIKQPLSFFKVIIIPLYFLHFAVLFVQLGELGACHVRLCGTAAWHLQLSEMC